jgi:hypothetical protein
MRRKGGAAAGVIAAAGIAWLAAWGCSKSVPEPGPGTRAAPGTAGTGGASASAPDASLGIERKSAQSIARQYAAKQWPKHAVSDAIGFREPKDWKVVLTFEGTDLGASVWIDPSSGQVLDSGIADGL